MLCESLLTMYKSAVVLTALVAAASALAPLHVNEQAIDGKFIVVFKKTS